MEHRYCNLMYDQELNQARTVDRFATAQAYNVIRNKWCQINQGWPMNFISERCIKEIRNECNKIIRDLINLKISPLFILLISAHILI